MAAENRSHGRSSVREELKTQEKLEENATSEEEEAQKQQREAMLEERIRKIREKNEQLLKRKQEIEEDIKNADVHSDEVLVKGQPFIEHKMAGVRTDNNKPLPKGRARGKLLAKMSREKPQAHLIEERQRRQNFKEVEEGLPSKPHFLADHRRADMSKTGSRSSHSWGGDNFQDGVVERMKKEKGLYRPPRRHQNIEVSMTGRERREYLQWKEERIKVDMERKERQKLQGGWKREWDQGKDQGRSTDSNREAGFGDRARASGQRFGQGSQQSNWSYHDNRGIKDESQDWMEREDQKKNQEKAESEDWGDRINQENKSVMQTEEDWEDSFQEVVPPKVCTNKVISSEEWEEKPNTESQEKERLFTNTKESPLHRENIKVSIGETGKREIAFDYKGTYRPEDLDNQNESGDASRVEPKSQRIVETARRQRQSGKSSADELEYDYIGINPDYQQHIKAKDDSGHTMLKEQIPKDDIKDTAEIKHSEKISKSSESSSKDDKEFRSNDVAPQVIEKEMSNQHSDNQKDDGSLVENRGGRHHPNLSVTIKPEEPEEEPIPDFLKTPKDGKKPWGDCEVDEEKLQNLPIQWAS